MKKRIGIGLLLIGLLSGCIGGTGKMPFVRQYILEYPPPQGMGLPAVEAMVRVERFAADRMFMGQAMLYRQGPFLREAYSAQRWRVSPGDMVTEFLRRDLREAGLFRAVLSERDAEEARFTLTGGVEEFIESWEGAGRKALLMATITLLDLSRKETAGLVVFQKTYRFEAAATGEGAAGLAAAMSLAMSGLSRQVIADIDSALTFKAPVK
jgi:ABC-type uncharacterized transport system auxiliary subunit